MKNTKRQKLEDIRFIYGVTSLSTRSRVKRQEWAPTEVFVRIVSPEAAQQRFRDTLDEINHPGTIGDATIFLYDIQQMEENNVNIFEELEEYSHQTYRIACLICDDTHPVSEKFCKKINKAFGTSLDANDIRRIAYVERRTTKAKYRGNGITSLFYEDIFRMFNPDVILTYPFPLQYEGKFSTKPAGGEFKLNFIDSMDKLKSIYHKAGMRSIDPTWMAMPNPRFTNHKNEH